MTPTFVPPSLGNEPEVDAHIKNANAASFVAGKFEEARNGRRIYEEKWIRAYNQIKGEYSPEELIGIQKLKEKNPYASEAFIKITKTKVFGAKAQLEDTLFGNGRIPLGVEATPEPIGIAKDVTILPEAIAVNYGFPGDGKDLQPGTSTKDIFSPLFNGLQNKYRKLMGQQVAVEGNLQGDPSFVHVSPAQEAAGHADRIIQDQLKENDFIANARKGLLDLTKYGSMVFKGPFTVNKEIPKWVLENKTTRYTPEYKLYPLVENISVWNCYPDPTAVDADSITYFIELHRLSKDKLQRLGKQNKNFNKENIASILRTNPGEAPEWWELAIKENKLNVDSRYKVLEYWGECTVENAKNFSIDVPDSLEDYEVVNVNIWVCNGLVIMARINPFIPERIPYYIIPYELEEGTVWGNGIPANMEDAQRMVNVHTRMAQDNLRLAGSVMLEVNESYLAPGQSPELYAGKIWRRQGGAPGQAIYPISFNSTAGSHIQLIDKAMQWGDQGSGISSYSYGQTGVQSIGRTSSGLSMLMGASSLAVKDVIRNIDAYLLEPLGRALYAWNMQFNVDNPEMRGDVFIVAQGTSSLLQKEVLSQRLLSLFQLSQSPTSAPYINMKNLIQDIALSLDVDKDRYVNDEEQTKLMSQLLQAQANVNYSGNQGQVGQPQQGNPQQPVGVNPQATGGGNGGGPIGDGSVAMSGQAAFTGNAT